MKRYYFKLIMGMIFMTSLVSTVETKGQTQTTEVDPIAVEILQGSLDYLSNLTQFSVQAQSTLEDMLDSEHRVDFEMSSSVTVSRPNKLHAERHGELFNQIFYYDGSTLTLYNPSDKVYATEPTPGTIDEMLHFARDTFGLGAPVSDLIYNNAFSLLMDEVNFAMVIGKEIIGDIHCTHLLFSRPGVDFQIWIADNVTQLPLKLVVTDTATPEHLSFTTVMRNWDMAPEVSESLFNFVPPQGTVKITFLKTDQSGETKP